MSCPSGFEVGLSNSCRLICPADYKYIQESGTEKCVAMTNNTYSVTLQKVAKGASTAAFTDEQSRFMTEFIKVTKQQQKDQAEEARLRAASSDKEITAHYEKIRSSHGVTGAYTEAIAELKPLRPPTQPTDDIMLAKLSIEQLSAQDVRVLQICLFFVVITLFEYLLLPTSVVHGVAFLTLCVGFSIAIYLRNR